MSAKAFVGDPPSMPLDDLHGFNAHGRLRDSDALSLYLVLVLHRQHGSASSSFIDLRPPGHNPMLPRMAIRSGIIRPRLNQRKHLHVRETMAYGCVFDRSHGAAVADQVIAVVSLGRLDRLPAPRRAESPAPNSRSENDVMSVSMSCIVRFFSGGVVNG